MTAPGDAAVMSPLVVTLNLGSHNPRPCVEFVIPLIVSQTAVGFPSAHHGAGERDVTTAPLSSPVPVPP